LLLPIAWADEFATLTSDLAKSGYSQKNQIIDSLAALDDERTLPMLKAMLDGNLYLQKSDKTVVIGLDTSAGVEITDIQSSDVLDVVGIRSLDKVKINNSVRGKLRTVIASLQLSAKDPTLRRQSARDLIKSPDPSLRDLIAQAYEQEASSSVKDEMALALALVDIESEDQNRRKSAIQILTDSYSPEALAILTRVGEKDSAGNYQDASAEVAKLAADGAVKVRDRMDVMRFIENLFFGVSLGSVLLLAAIGLAITFGVMGVINMAHGEMIMLGAYTTFA